MFVDSSTRALTYMRCQDKCKSDKSVHSLMANQKTSALCQNKQRVEWRSLWCLITHRKITATNSPIGVMSRLILESNIPTSV